tara:strand:+ start:529 stop:783 length:255 start_codon:yes stop_codon:yes gene_type:complete
MEDTYESEMEKVFEIIKTDTTGMTLTCFKELIDITKNCNRLGIPISIMAKVGTIGYYAANDPLFKMAADLITTMDPEEVLGNYE